jgi:HSP20 family protein
MFETTPFNRENSDMAGGDNFAARMEMNQNPFIVDVRESDDAYLIEAELPGIRKEDIGVDYKDNHLTLSARREDKAANVSDNFVKHERHFGDLKRSFYVDDIDESRIETSFQDGILRVVLYKHSITRMKRMDPH